jgi:hypothetical protein
MQRFFAGAGVVCAGICLAIGLGAAQTAIPAHAQAAPTELPPGPAKAIIERSCTGCHGVENILGKRASKEDWDNTVNTMVSRGADLSDAEIPVVVAYLAKNFPDPNAKPAATAPASSGDAAPAAPAKN